MENDRQYVGYIYCVTNKINNKKYIGQTIRTISKRWSTHKTESKTENNPSYFHKSILKYGFDNFIVSEVKKIVCHSKDELREELNYLEKKYIREFNTIRPNGYNLTVGGDTSSYVKCRPIVQISKHGEIVEKYNSIADATRALNISEGALSSVLYGFTNKAHGYYWKFLDDVNLNKYIENIKQPYVAMYDKDGKLEKIYDDAKEASIEQNVTLGRIKQCCTLERKHSKEKQFRLYFDIDDIPKSIDKLVVEWGRGIKQYDLYGKLIKEYKNIKDVLKQNPNYTASPIRNCCNGFRNKAYNYIWKYVEG